MKCGHAYSASKFVADSTRLETNAMAAQASSSSIPSLTDEDLEKLLNREASAFNRELEVERILKAFKLKYIHSPFSDLRILSAEINAWFQSLRHSRYQ